MKIEKIIAREILDSRGNPTVEVDVFTSNGMGRASVPSGASTGIHEALELRDGGARYHGKGVLKAVDNVNNIIAPSLIGMDVSDQKEIDSVIIELDGTENKSRLGANATLGVSLACAKAAANSLRLPLYEYLGGTNVIPVPTLNILNGGKHAGNKLEIQEFMIQPVGAPSFSEGLRYAAEVYHTLGDILEARYGKSALNVGFEGGYAPPMDYTREALDAVWMAVEKAGYSEKEIRIGIDAAASEFHYREGMYELDGGVLTSEDLIDLYVGLVEDYPIIYIEDPFHEDAFLDFAELTKILKDVLVVGDDIFVTNVNRIKKGIETRAANAMILKVNQIGTLTEAIEASKIANRAGWKIVVSHRSAETEDVTISHLAVALSASLIKAGAPARGERTAKYNELLRIEERLGKKASYAVVVR
ncbi:phosphopyruvate hydratase [Methanosarcinales archaeon]|nr:MAG: phosphopyruvate hydratase [Methanosarcinales archaeon]